MAKRVQWCLGSSSPRGATASSGDNISHPSRESFNSAYPCRAICFSPNGQYMATASGQTLKLWRTDTWTDVATIEGTKAYFLVFSPLSRYLMTWEPYEVSKDKPQGSPNLNLYKCENGELVKGFMHKSQTNW